MRIVYSLIGLFLLKYVGAAPSSTCISKGKEAYGNDSGTAYSDFTYLKAKEEVLFYFRMTGLNICTDTNGNLIGMQSLVTKYSLTDNFAVIELLENKIGTVSGTCKTVRVDPTK
jgi:hypothetical protein